MASGGSANIMDFINIPVSIVLGILLGILAGCALGFFFESAYSHQHCVRNSEKVIIVLAVSFLLMSIETWVRKRRICGRGASALLEPPRRRPRRYQSGVAEK